MLPTACMFCEGVWDSGHPLHVTHCMHVFCWGLGQRAPTPCYPLHACFLRGSGTAGTHSMLPTACMFFEGVWDSGHPLHVTHCMHVFLGGLGQRAPTPCYPLHACFLRGSGTAGTYSMLPTACTYFEGVWDSGHPLHVTHCMHVC